MTIRRVTRMKLSHTITKVPSLKSLRQLEAPRSIHGHRGRVDSKLSSLMFRLHIVPGLAVPISLAKVQQRSLIPGMIFPILNTFSRLRGARAFAAIHSIWRLHQVRHPKIRPLRFQPVSQIQHGTDGIKSGVEKAIL